MFSPISGFRIFDYPAGQRPAKGASPFEGRIRKTDQLCRFGGEEFVVLLPHTSLPEGFHLPEAPRVAVERQRFGHDETLSVSGSIWELGRRETPDSC